MSTLVHHTMMVSEGQIDSRLLDKSLGLSWRNDSPDALFLWAEHWEDSGHPFFSEALLMAAILKENAINNGINLEDRI